jgi:hypothetical protein
LSIMVLVENRGMRVNDDCADRVATRIIGARR